MRKLIDWMGDNIPPFIALVFVSAILYGVYKFFAGVYHLLDKLIDKL